MARILICHVPKDGSTARDLGATLMGRGHFVSFDGEPDTPRPDRLSRLRQFEAVIVLWSEMSAQNPGLMEIAREALPLNLLIPVRPSELDASRLPLMFRKLNMLSPRDIDGIARMVGRLSAAASSLREFAASSRENAEAQRKPEPAPVASSPAATRKPAQTPIAKRPTTESVQPEPTLERANVRVRPLSDLPEVEAGPFERREPTLSPHGGLDPGGAPRDKGQYRATGFDRPSAGVITAEDLSKAVEAGLLAHHIPEAMWLGSPTTVELRLDRDVLASVSRPEVGQSVETLSISLYGVSEVFEIERQSERTQFVTAKHMTQARDPATVGRWAWLVTPRALGPQDLVVRVSALLRDRRGVPAPVALPDRRFSVEIQAPEGESLISALAGWRRR